MTRSGPAYLHWGAESIGKSWRHMQRAFLLASRCSCGAPPAFRGDVDGAQCVYCGGGRQHIASAVLCVADMRGRKPFTAGDDSRRHTVWSLPLSSLAGALACQGLGKAGVLCAA